MPIYEYRCPNGHTFELFQRMTDPAPEVCEVCGVDRSLVVAMVEEGIAAPLDSESTHWEFSGVAVTRIRTATRLHRDLEVNLAGAALVLDLLEEIETLRGTRNRED